MPLIATDVTVVCASVCPSATFVRPAKAVVRNEMPFDRDNRVVSTNVVLDRGPDPPRKGSFG